MTKVTVDRALIEQALDSVKDFIEYREMRSPSYLRDALRAVCNDCVQHAAARVKEGQCQMPS